MIDPDPNRQILAFGDFILDADEALLTRHGEAIPLAPKELQLLTALLKRAGHLVSKDVLMEEVWADTFVTDSSLVRNISILRRNLGHQSIRTVPKRGYVFALPVCPIGEEAKIAAPLTRATRRPGADLIASFGGEVLGGSEDSAVVLSPGPEEGLSNWRKMLNAISIGSGIASRRMTGISIALLVLTISTGAVLRDSSKRGTDRRSSLSGTNLSPELAGRSSKLYVLNQGDHSVSILHPSVQRKALSVPFAADPRGVAIRPDRSVAYFSLNGTNSVLALNLRTNEILAEIPVGNSPVGVAANPRPPYIYVANNYSNTVSIIDSRSNTVEQDLLVGNVPTEIAFTSDGTNAIVTNQSGGSITLIDSIANRVLVTISVGSTPVGVAVTPDSKYAWVTLAGENAVAVIDLATRKVLEKIQVGLGPVRVAISRDGKYALISNFFANTVTVIDIASRRSKGTIAVGLNPVGISFDSAGVFAYVADYGSKNVSVIDALSLEVVANLDVGNNPVELTLLPCYASPCE